MTATRPSRRWSRAAATAVLLGVLSVTAACTAHSRTSAHDLSTGPISFAVADRSPALDQAVQTWNDRHADQQVSVTSLPTDPAERRDALVENLQNRNPGYDVLATDLTETAELADQHWLSPLTGSLAISPAGLVPNATAVGSWHGSLYAAPFDVSPGLLFYRNDLMRTPPQTWSSVGSACSLAQHNGLACFTGQYAPGADLADNIVELISAAGGRVVSADGATTQLDSSQSVAAFTFLADSYRQQVIPPAAVTYGNDQSVRAFDSGAVLMLRATPTAWSQLAAQTSQVVGHVGVAVLPGKDGPAPTVYNGTGLAINVAGRHQKTAAAFIRYLLGSDVQRSMLVDDGQAPALLSLYSDQQLEQRFPFLTVLLQSMGASQPAPVTPVFSQLRSLLSDAGYADVTGAKAPSQAASDLQTAASALHPG